MTIPLALRPQQLAPFDQQAAWQTAQAKLDSISTQLKQGKAQVTLSQTEVRALIDQELSQTNAPVKGVDVSLAAGRMDIRATVTLNGTPMAVTIGGSPAVSGQNLVLTVDKVQIGSLPLPVGSALQLLSSTAGLEVNASARTVTVPLSNLALDGKPVRLDSLALNAGQLTVDLSSK